MFELCKAKIEEKKARREATIAIDMYINTLSENLATTFDPEERTKIIDELAKVVSIKEVYGRKNTEMLKLKSEIIITTLKILTLVGSVIACEVVTNRNTGDRIMTDAISRVPNIK